MTFFKWVLAAFFLTVATVVYAGPLGDAENDRDGEAAGPSLVQVIAAKVSTDLGERFPGARIEFTESARWLGLEAQGRVRAIHVTDENGRGEAHFTVQCDTDHGLLVARGSVGFAAWLPARVASRRIMPGEVLAPDLFTDQEINVASGQAREFRGVILPVSTSVRGLEARQTIIEGQYLLSSAVERTPDIRRGDAVQIHLVSGGLTLSAAGIAEEPANFDGRVRVLTAKTKRELVGKLGHDGIVEVRL